MIAQKYRWNDAQWWVTRPVDSASGDLGFRLRDCMWAMQAEVDRLRGAARLLEYELPVWAKRLASLDAAFRDTVAFALNAHSRRIVAANALHADADYLQEITNAVGDRVVALLYPPVP